MATVINIPRDTRGEELSNSIAQLIETVVESRRNKANQELLSDAILAAKAPAPVGNAVEGERLTPNSPNDMTGGGIGPEAQTTDDVLATLLEGAAPGTSIEQMQQLINTAIQGTQEIAPITPTSQAEIASRNRNADQAVYASLINRASQIDAMAAQREADRLARAQAQEDKQEFAREERELAQIAAIAKANANEGIRIGGEHMDVVASAGALARDTRRNVALLREFAPQVQSGPAAPVIARAVGFFKQFGIDIGEEALLGEGGTAASLVLADAQLDFAKQFFEQTKGAISDREHAAFIGASPGLTQTQEGNLLMAEIQDKVAQRAEEQEAFLNKAIIEPNFNFASIPSLLDDWRNAQPDLFTPEELTQIQETAQRGLDNPIAPASTSGRKKPTTPSLTFEEQLDKEGGVKAPGGATIKIRGQE